MWEDCAQQLRSLNASDQDKLDAILEWTNECLLEHTDAFVQLSVELLERQNQVKIATLHRQLQRLAGGGLHDILPWFGALPGMRLHQVKASTCLVCA
jgi:hypothetical protein